VRKVLADPATPPGCTTPTPTSQDIEVPSGVQDVDMIEPLGLMAEAAENEPSLEALLGMAARNSRDIHGEALMEFALELYLQEYDGDIQTFQGEKRKKI
jgi:hypothetical protein